MNRRLPFLIRQIEFALRGGFLIRPLTITLTLGLAGAVFAELEESFPRITESIPHYLLHSSADPVVAQTILGGIAASTMTVVSIVFAVLLMTLTLASMQYSPRIIVSFVRDKVTQWTLGIFLGTFCYCMAALPAAHSLPTPFSPVATVTGAMILAVICVALLLFFIQHISQSISVNHIVDRIAEETEQLIDEMMPNPRGSTPESESGAAEMDKFLPGVLNKISGYLRFVDGKRLAAVAKQYDCDVLVMRRVGQFVPAGIPLLMMSHKERLTHAAEEEFRGGFDFGPTRNMQQDIEFGVLQIVDIALKAAGNSTTDPSTAITCVDQLSRILIRFAARELPPATIEDPPGVSRVTLLWPDFERIVEAALEQVRIYTQTDVAVSLRILRALTDIGDTTTNRDDHEILAAKGRQVLAGCASRLKEDELRDMRARVAVLEARLR